MEVIAGIACLIGLLYLLRRHGVRQLDALVTVGAIRRPAKDAAQCPDFIALTSIGNHGYENRIAAQLHDEGVRLILKGERDEVLLPLDLLTTTDAQWTFPLEFGAGNKRVGLNLGNAVTATEVQRMKQMKTANQAAQPTPRKRVEVDR